MTNIEWTEKTWNPVVGCTKVSPGCKHCYAERMAFRLRKMALADLATGGDPGRKRHYLDAVGEGFVTKEGDYPLRDSKGGDPSEWPEDLRVREWPKRIAVQGGCS